MSYPATATFTAFAGIARVRKSWVTQLRKDGRLVLTDDGKLVRVAESMARIEATRDPAKAGVTARHAATRGRAAAVTAPPPAAPQTSPPPAQADDDPDPDDANETTGGFQYWRKRRERAQALAAERDNRVAGGELLPAGEVTSAVASATASLRNALENLPNTLAPELAAAADESRVRVILAEAIEHALEEISRQFDAIAKADS